MCLKLDAVLVSAMLIALAQIEHYRKFETFFLYHLDWQQPNKPALNHQSALQNCLMRS